MAARLERNVFGQYIVVKKLIMSAVSVSFYPVFRWLNPLVVTGAEGLLDLPRRGVLFVSNHQTVFADGIALHQIMAATLAGERGSTRGLRYLVRPNASYYYVAAAETMASGWIPRILAYGSAVCVERTWKEGERAVARNVDLQGFHNIGRALSDGWVLTFPQGTTRPFAPGRIGTAHLIRAARPLVVPVVVSGFYEAFGKSGIAFRNPGRPVRVCIKDPLALDYDAAPEVLLAQVMEAIEQSESHHLKARAARAGACAADEPAPVAPS